MSESTFEVHSTQLMESRGEIISSKANACIWSNEHTLTPLIYIVYILLTGSEWNQCSDSSDMGITM